MIFQEDARNEALDELIGEMRARLDELEEENRALRQQNIALRDELNVYITRPPVEVRRSAEVPRRSRTERRQLRWNPEEGLRERTRRRQGWGDDGGHRPPGYIETEESAPGAAVFRRHVSSEHMLHNPPSTPAPLASAHMGRPLGPESWTGPPNDPSPPMQNGLDLGYINRVGRDELNALPYGLIVLNAEGEVVFYNETESRLAGFERERVTGRNFFREVAPCTRVKEFEGRFRDFVQGRLGSVVTFDFAFHFEHGTQRVLIALSAGRRKGLVNVMLMRR